MLYYRLKMVKKYDLIKLCFEKDFKVRMLFSLERYLY
jgi:hypothetical protein